MRDDVEILEGDQIGAYRVIDRDGAATGVYGAVDVVLAHGVRIKIGSRAPISTLRHACCSTTLEHPGIAPIVGCGVLPDQRLWTATSTPHGVGLFDILARRTLYPGELLALLRDLASVLIFAHERGAVHRSLDTRSITLSTGGNGYPVCIVGWTDRRIDPGIRPTVFTAPELVPRSRDRDATRRSIGGRADVYALGVIAYRALTGGFPPPMPTDVPGASTALAALLLDLLAPDPAHRLTAKIVRVRAARLLAVMTSAAELPRSPAEPPIATCDLEWTKRSTPAERRRKKPMWTPTGQAFLTSGQIISGEIDTDSAEAA